MIDSISSNTTLVALANIMALLGAAALIVKGTIVLYRFIRNVYRANIRVAWFRFRRRTFFRSVACAMDVHYFISYLVMRFALFSLAVIALIGNVPKPIKSRQEFIDAPPRMHFESYQSYVEFNRIFNDINALTGIFIIFYIVMVVSRLYFVSFNVMRLRQRWNMRKARRNRLAAFKQ